MKIRWKVPKSLIVTLIFASLSYHCLFNCMLLVFYSSAVFTQCGSMQKPKMSILHLRKPFPFWVHFLDHMLECAVVGLTKSLRARLWLWPYPGEWMKVGLLGKSEDDVDCDEDELWAEEDALICSHFSPRALAKWSSTDTLIEICLEEPFW